MTHTMAATMLVLGLASTAGAMQRVAVTSTTNDGHAHTVTFN